MQQVTVQTILNHEISQALGHTIYVVRHAETIFYIGQSKRDVVSRFWEHMQKPSRLGQLIQQNAPNSYEWLVYFYTLADCRPFVSQKRLFPDQAWEHFDMDMAEQALIAHFRPALNRDFNPHPTPLPTHYRGQTTQAAPPTSPLLNQGDNRLWLNQMQLQGWVRFQDENGRFHWQHRSGKTMNDEAIRPYRHANRIPPSDE